MHLETLQSNYIPFQIVIGKTCSELWTTLDTLGPCTPRTPLATGLCNTPDLDLIEPMVIVTCLLFWRHVFLAVLQSTHWTVSDYVAVCSVLRPSDFALSCRGSHPGPNHIQCRQFHGSSVSCSSDNSKDGPPDKKRGSSKNGDGDKGGGTKKISSPKCGDPGINLDPFVCK